MTVSGITGDGTLGISLAAGTAVDAAGNGACRRPQRDVHGGQQHSVGGDRSSFRVADGVGRDVWGAFHGRRLGDD